MHLTEQNSAVNDSPRQAGARNSSIVRMQECLDQERNGLLDRINAFTKRCNDSLVLERQPFSKSYEEGRLELCFLVPRSSCACKSESLPSIGERFGGNEQIAVFRANKAEDSGSVHRKAEVQSKFVPAHFRNAAGQDKQPMLVLSVQPMQCVKHFVPSGVGLEGCYCLDDLFAGELYLSLINGACKTLCFFGEGERNKVRAGRLGAGELEHGKIESRAQVMDGVANDKREFLWDGDIGFDSDGNLVCLRVEMPQELEWPFVHERVDLTPKIIDVMLGPFNL
jgi:hypothetical protein